MTVPVELRSTVKVKVSPSPPYLVGVVKKPSGSYPALHEHAPDVRVMRTVNWPPAAGTSMVPPGEAEYAHAPNWVTVIVALAVGIVALPLGHETVSVPVRGVPEGFSATR